MKLKLDNIKRLRKAHKFLFIAVPVVACLVLAGGTAVAVYYSLDKEVPAQLDIYSGGGGGGIGGVYYNLTVLADPVEGGVVTGEGKYKANSVAEITATPNEGYIFVEWTASGTTVDDPLSDNATCTITGNATVTAKFELIQEVELYADPELTIPLGDGVVMFNNLEGGDVAYLYFDPTLIDYNTVTIVSVGLPENSYYVTGSVDDTGMITLTLGKDADLAAGMYPFTIHIIGHQ